MKVYQTVIINPMTGEKSIRFCQTDKGFAYAVSRAIESVESDTIAKYLPDKWVIESEIMAQ